MLLVNFSEFFACHFPPLYEHSKYKIFSVKKNVENIILSAHVRAENDMQKNSEKLTKTTDLGMLLLIKNRIFLGIF